MEIKIVVHGQGLGAPFVNIKATWLCEAYICIRRYPNDANMSIMGIRDKFQLSGRSDNINISHFITDWVAVDPTKVTAFLNPPALSKHKLDLSTSNGVSIKQVDFTLKLITPDGDVQSTIEKMDCPIVDGSHWGPTDIRGFVEAWPPEALKEYILKIGTTLELLPSRKKARRNWRNSIR